MFANLESEALRIEVRAEGDDCMQVRWTGRSNSRNPGQSLDPYLQDLVESAKGTGKKIEMHFEDLHYLNSSTVSSLIRFIRGAKDGSLKVELIYDNTRAWQRLSFDALRILADGERFVLKGLGN